MSAVGTAANSPQARPSGPGRLAITTRRYEGTLVMRLTGRLDLHNAPQLAAAVTGQLDGGPAVLIFDLTGLRVLGAAAAIALGTAADACDGRIEARVVAAGPARRVLELTAPDHRLPVFETLAAALDGDGTGRVADLQHRLAQLDAKLASQPAIEQAKGVLMYAFGMDAATAFQVLSQLSQDTQVKLHVVAELVVAELVGTGSDTSSRAASRAVESIRRRLRPPDPTA